MTTQLSPDQHQAVIERIRQSTRDRAFTNVSDHAARVALRVCLESPEIAAFFDRRPTRERFLHLLNSPDEDGWRLLGRQCSRFADLMEAAGFVRDDPAPVVSQFKTREECEAWLDERFPYRSGKESWSIDRIRTPNGHRWAARCPGHFVYSSPSQLEALNKLIAANAGERT